MLFSNKETIKDLIIKELLNKDKNVEDLQKDLKNKHNIKVSIFGLYKILRNLKNEEGSIVKVGKEFSISEEWKKGALNFLSINNNDLKLEEKERLDFKFNSLINLDHYWKNLVLKFHSNNKAPIFLYAKHQFWIMLNKNKEKSETEYIKSFDTEKRFAFYSIVGNSINDNSFKKRFSTEYVKINTDENLVLASNSQLTIFEDYIIITIIPKLVQEKINFYYQTIKNELELKRNIEKMHIENKNVRLVIERNEKKAKILRKKLSKNFYIPKELVEKYGLF